MPAIRVHWGAVYRERLYALGVGVVSQIGAGVAGRGDAPAKSGMRDKTKMRYQIIYADPPWDYNDKGCNGASQFHYPSMTIDELCALPIKDLSDDNFVLFMWATFPKLNEVFRVITAWGFEYKTVAFTWIKLNPKSKTVFKGIGRWVQGNAEIVLLATK